MNRLHTFLARRAMLMVLPALLLLGASSASGLELVMVNHPNCEFCKMFETEIGGGYNKTEFGKKAPLRRVDVTKAWPEDLDNIRPDKLTPTFILVEDGKEAGRLRGYPGPDQFWTLLSRMLELHEKDRNINP